MFSVQDEGATGGEQVQSDRVFELAAELFSLLGTPMRLRILSALCDGERSVSQLLETMDTTQPNLSQHLAVMYKHLRSRRNSS